MSRLSLHKSDKDRIKIIRLSVQRAIFVAIQKSVSFKQVNSSVFSQIFLEDKLKGKVQEAPNCTSLRTSFLVSFLSQMENSVKILLLPPSSGLSSQQHSTAVNALFKPHAHSPKREERQLWPDVHDNIPRVPSFLSKRTNY